MWKSFMRCLKGVAYLLQTEMFFFNSFVFKLLDQGNEDIGTQIHL